MPELCSVYITVPTKEEALDISRKLVSLKLAACVNIIDNVTSVYNWDGKMQEDAEVVILAKTRRGLFDELFSEVKAIHSYENPCIVAFPIAVSSAEYAGWVINGTKDPAVM